MSKRSLGVSRCHALLFEFERNIPFKQLQDEQTEVYEAALGNEESISNLGMAYTVKSGGRNVTFGHYKGRFWGQTVGVIRRVFEARKEQRFAVQTRVTKARPDLQQLNPRLKVTVEMQDMERLMFTGASLQIWSLVYGMGSFVSFLVSGCCLLKALRRQREIVTRG